MNKLDGKIMIELGVQKGLFAFEVLKRWRSFEHYYGIDPWQEQKNYIDGANIDKIKQNENYEVTKKRLSIFGNSRIKLIREYSKKAVKYFDDFSIDLIYIDARHDFCSVIEDIQLYFPKLKCGGVFAGHDFLDVKQRFKLHNPKKKIKGDYGICPNGTRVLKNGGAVKGAVIEFFSQNKKMHNMLLLSFTTLQSVIFTSPPRKCSLKAPIANIFLLFKPPPYYKLRLQPHTITLHIKKFIYSLPYFLQDQFLLYHFDDIYSTRHIENGTIIDMSHIQCSFQNKDFCKTDNVNSLHDMGTSLLINL
ncbi:O-methyltransferase [Brachionus plicatilis]|uniref:O-methyltransferase n=1 Tax=Brachionus plicatilis TaxID=10195 RepID=A0A3M7P8H8_BRAPC|nr:O-methyltransferase [Brachionus plicatilis]